MSISSRLRMAILSVGFVTSAAIVPAFAADPPVKPAAAPAPTTAPTPHRGSIDLYKDLLVDLKLSPEQQAKIDAITAKTKEEYKTNAATLGPKPTEDAVAKVKNINQAAFDKMKKEITEVLTPDQHIALRAKLVHNQMVQRKKMFEKVQPKLTDDQQKKVDAVIDDAEKKLNALDADKIKNGTDVKEKIAAISDEMMKQFREIAPEQTKALEK